MGILDIFDKFRDTIFLKENFELEEKVKYLERQKEINPNDENIKQQLYMASKGLKGENEIVYQLKKSNIGMYVLHDINIKYEDLNAQIDFVIITAWACYFIECKNLIGNITVNDKGDFIRDYTYNGCKIRKGMESPYRQVCAQRDVFKKLLMKNRGKLSTLIIEKNFEYNYRVLVVATNGENILNTQYDPNDIKYNTIKADGLIRKLEYDRDHSKKEEWSNKAQMEEWATNILKLNIQKDCDFEKQSCMQENNKPQKEIKDKVNEELKNRLIEFRKNRAKEKNLPLYYVFNNDELEKILEYRPKTMEELQELNILPHIKFLSHGKEIVEVINIQSKIDI